jgi:hypothetical protein
VPAPDGITAVSYCAETRELADCAECEETLEEFIFAENLPECEGEESPLRDAVSRMLQGLGAEEEEEAEGAEDGGRRRGIFGRRGN